MRHINNSHKCGIWTIPKDYFLRKKHSLNFFVLEKVPINPPNLFTCAIAKYPFLWIHNITFYKDLLTQETSNKPPPIRRWLSWGPVYDTKRGRKRWLRQMTWQQNGLNRSTSSAQVETQVANRQKQVFGFISTQGNANWTFNELPLCSRLHWGYVKMKGDRNSHPLL